MGHWSTEAADECLVAILSQTETTNSDGYDELTDVEAGFQLRRQLALEDREVFVAVLMNTRDQVLSINTVSIGSLSAFRQSRRAAPWGRRLPASGCLF